MNFWVPASSRDFSSSHVIILYPFPRLFHKPTYYRAKCRSSLFFLPISRRLLSIAFTILLFIFPHSPGFHFSRWSHSLAPLPRFSSRYYFLGPSHPLSLSVSLSFSFLFSFFSFLSLSTSFSHPHDSCTIFGCCNVVRSLAILLRGADSLPARHLAHLLSCSDFVRLSYCPKDTGIA